MSDLENSLSKALGRAKTKKKTQKHRNTSSKVEKTVQPERGRGGHVESVNPHTKRVTLDVTPHQDKVLAQFALDNGTKKNPVLRRVIELIESDPEFRERILADL